MAKCCVRPSGGMAQPSGWGWTTRCWACCWTANWTACSAYSNAPLERHVHRRRHAYPPDAALAAARAELPTLAQARAGGGRLGGWLGPEAVLRTP